MITNEHIQGLVGQSYEDVGGCWGLAKAVCDRVGLCLPETPEAALASPSLTGRRVSAPSPGDLVMMQDPREAGQHVGVIVDHQSVIHAMRDGGVRVDRLSRLDPVRVIRYVRLGVRDER